MKNHLLFHCATLMLWGVCGEALSTSASTPAQASSDMLQARITRVEQGLSPRVVIKGSRVRKMALTERMAFYHVPAISIALIDHGRLAWSRAYGIADIASQRPATTRTLFQAASISKTVSAMGALRLVERGKLSLDGDVNRELASWKIPQNEFTRQKAVSLRMLLNHSAGTTVHGFDGYAPGQPLPTLRQILDGMAPANSQPVRVDIVPGTAWRYSGGGYSIVQLMMTEASGQPFAKTMDKSVLGPLGMVNSTYVTPLPNRWRARAATAYDSHGEAIAGGWHNYPQSAAAGLWTTPSDLARVVIAVQQAEAGESEKVLSRDMTSTMLTRGLGEYGLGFFVEDLGDRTSFSHSGGNDGFRAQLYGYTRSGQGVVVMTNGDNGAALIDELMTSIADEYGWPEFHVVEKDATAEDAALNKEVAGH